MDNKENDLCKYRLDSADETLRVAKLCMENGHYKDAINRSYYAAFYAVKAVLAIEGKDFKRHKDVVAYFNQQYISTDKFPREAGRKLANLQQKRENGDYNDFFVASRDETQKQYEAAEYIIGEVRKYIGGKNYD